MIVSGTSCPWEQQHGCRYDVRTRGESWWLSACLPIQQTAAQCYHSLQPQGGKITVVMKRHRSCRGQGRKEQGWEHQPHSISTGWIPKVQLKLSLRTSNLQLTRVFSPADFSSKKLTAELDSEYLLLLDLMTLIQHLAFNTTLFACHLPKQWLPPTSLQ